MDIFENQEPEEVVSDFCIPNEKKIELLRSILETKSESSVTFRDAEEVARRLVSFYESLAGDRKIIPGLQDES